MVLAVADVKYGGFQAVWVVEVAFAAAFGPPMGADTPSLARRTGGGGHIRTPSLARRVGVRAAYFEFF